MADNHSKEVRSMNMSHIRSTNSKPEEKVRKYLFACDLRYRKNDRRLPGCPDLVFPKYKTVVFVNGCFWHHHDCGRFVWPKSNEEYWHKKITRNVERDQQNIKQLKSQGWNVITIWECQLKPVIREQTLESLAYTLNHIYLNDRSVKLYEIQEDNQLLAAESDCDYMKENLK